MTSIKKRRHKWGWLLFIAAVAVVLLWVVGGNFIAVKIATPVQFSLKHGSGLRSAARHLETVGAVASSWRFEMLARAIGLANRIQAGNYEISADITPYQLLVKVTSGDHRQDKLTIVEGWTFRQLRAAVDAHPALRHDLESLRDGDIAQRLGISSASPEGLFFPDTYFFVNGTSDLAVLQRAHRMLQSQLNTVWQGRETGLPIESPYEALILGSIVEKETGQGSERSMIAAVFINRLRLGMKLQTDPTVIYGLGEGFDGNLRKRDLITDTPFNTYTRNGLPPTPIAMPGLGALNAALHPAKTKALYFVARGDGTSKFSESLAEHERAVTKYQRQGNR
jgi:UPF0755 protein